jgi:hypothetical protein
MLTNIPGALSGAALLALLSTARRKNSRFFHQRPHQIILLGLTSFGGLQRARVAAKRYHLDLHKRVERKRVENFVEFTRIVDIEDADVHVLARDAYLRPARSTVHRRPSLRGDWQKNSSSECSAPEWTLIFIVRSRHATCTTEPKLGASTGTTVIAKLRSLSVSAAEICLRPSRNGGHRTFTLHRAYEKFWLSLNPNEGA